VVGTPGRIEEHTRKGSLQLEQLKVLVLDEADRMLDMGFEPQIAQVVQRAPAERQTLLFSASYPDTISALGRRYQRDALRIDVLSSAAELARASSGEAGQVEQRFYRVSEAQRIPALGRWLALERPVSALIFCNTRSECAQAAEHLRDSGWVAASIQGEMAQRERQHAMRLFANGSCTLLVATDVAARGWDIPDLPLVVNLGLSRDPTVHLHRVGRTGRLGKAGLVVSFVSEQDVHALQVLERNQRQPLPLLPLPQGSALLPPPKPARVTLILSAGKDKKLRPGDILGSLTAEGGIPGADVGTIQIDDSSAYVAVAASSAERALSRVQQAGIKGRSVKARLAGLDLRTP
jgi:ATP-independent RNA helicase DbpA